jgi:hypothetical protein
MFDSFRWAVSYTNDNNLDDCPAVDISIRDLRVTAVLDSGSQVSILAESAYEMLV